MISDIANVIIWLLIAVFLLHVIEGNATEWVMSKFKRGFVDKNGHPINPGTLNTPGSPADSSQTGDRTLSGNDNPPPPASSSVTGDTGVTIPDFTPRPGSFF